MPVSFPQRHSSTHQKTDASQCSATMDSIIQGSFEQSESAVFGVDNRGRIGYWNARIPELFDLPQGSTLNGLHCSDLLCGGQQQCSDRCCQSCAIKQTMLDERQINHYTLSIRAATGKTRHVKVSTCYVYPTSSDSVSTYFSLRIEKDSK